jgi:hypothetical protein
VSASRYIDAKLFDFTSDGCLIVDGKEGEHLIIKLGPSHVANLDYAISKYKDSYIKQETPLEP